MGRVQSASQGTTIAVAGTSASTALDAAGAFRLNVSPGDVQLQVTSRGASAMVGIQSVQPSQTVEVSSPSPALRRRSRAKSGTAAARPN